MSLSYITAIQEPREVVVNFHCFSASSSPTEKQFQAILTFVPNEKRCWKITFKDKSSESLPMVKSIETKLNLLNFGSHFVQAILKGSATEIQNFIDIGVNVNCVISNDNFTVTLKEAKKDHGFAISHRFKPNMQCDCFSWASGDLNHNPEQCKNGEKHARWGNKFNLEYEKLVEERLTPLHIAILTGRKLIVLKLIKAGARPNIKDINGKTALHTLAENSSTEFHDEVISSCKDRDIDIRDGEGNTALHIAINRGNKVLTEKLIGVEASLNLVNNEGFTPLMLAAAKQDVDILKLLLDHVDVDQQVESRGNALSVAVEYSKKGQHRVVDLLLEKGADPFAGKNLSKSAIRMAAFNNELELLKKIIAAKTEATDEDKKAHFKSAFEAAVLIKEIKLVKELVTQLGDTFFDEHILDILSVVTSKQDLDSVRQRVISRGYALCIAAEHSKAGEHGVVDLLLEKEADPFTIEDLRS